MNEVDIIDQDSLRKNALLIPIAVIIGTSIAIAAYTFVPENAMGLILLTSIIASYAIFNKIKKD
ncbi:MAG TPA: hypothetical protein C5S51_12080 [Methanosarcinaceae archaeon]|nr:hypothetical protein [Methanosarcinaceae archaeon]